jgi:hypothetical protein
MRWTDKGKWEKLPGEELSYDAEQRAGDDGSK